MFDTTWAGLKQIASQKNLTLQYADDGTRYTIVVVDGSLEFYTVIKKTEQAIEGSDQFDFETNYKEDCNKKISDEVVTYFEKNDKDLKITSDYCVLDENHCGEIRIKVPGVLLNGDGRFIDEGVGFFEPSQPGDWVTNVEITDFDNVLGYGAGAVVKCYHDDDGIEQQRGWRIPFKKGQVEIDTLAGYGFIPAELYLVIKGRRGSGVTESGTMYCNIKWGKLG